MEKEFVPFNLAVKLKELGFECDYSFKEYDTKGYLQQTGLLSSHDLPHVDAPLWQQCFDWFREKHRLDFNIDYQYDTDKKNGYKTHYFIDIHKIVDTGKLFFNKRQFLIDRHESFKVYNTYEEARKKCLEKLIELVENETV